MLAYDNKMLLEKDFDMIFIFCILFLLFLALISRLFKKAGVKGKFGELFLAWRLKNSLDNSQYTIINDVIISDESGGTTQIDHVVFSPFGIFVIETKNMKGWIFGNRDERVWKQQIYRKKYDFQNPFLQNYKHICNLSKTIGLPQECLVHIVVFLGGIIKNREYLPENLVTSGTETLDFISRFQNEIISSSLLDNAIANLQANRLANNSATRKKHIEYVKNIAENKYDGVKFCPWCGNPMVLRKASKGIYAGQPFWGCSRYPACKCIIKEIEE